MCVNGGPHHSAGLGRHERACRALQPPLLYTPCAAAPGPLPRRGELYFELHRGTYTTHAASKADNRACELLLREAEAAGAMAAALLPPGSYCYPK